MNTFLIFTDLPVHIEYRISDWPIMYDGLKIQFKIDLIDPRNIKKVRKIDGMYTVISRKLIYSNDKSSSPGLSQYIELDPAK